MLVSGLVTAASGLSVAGATTLSTLTASGNNRLGQEDEDSARIMSRAVVSINKPWSSDPVLALAGLVTASAGMSVPLGDVSIDDGNLILKEGDLTVTDGQLTVTKGDLTLTEGDVTVTKGDLTVTGGATALSTLTTSGKCIHSMIVL